MKIKFRPNMSMPDRAIRTVVGLTLWTVGPVLEFVTPDELSNILMAAVGTLALVSAFFAYCILYEITGFGVARKS
jgi:hypothetical protein